MPDLSLAASLAYLLIGMLLFGLPVVAARYDDERKFGYLMGLLLLVAAICLVGMTLSAMGVITMSTDPRWINRMWISYEVYLVYFVAILTFVPARRHRNRP